MKETGLQVQNVRKSYPGGLLANDSVSLEIHPGEVFGLLGPNGAGKTTLVRQIVGLLRPDQGVIRMAGVDLIRFPEQARRLCCYLPQANTPIDSLRPIEAIEMIGRLRGGPRSQVRRRTAELMRALEIEEWKGTIGLRLSGGVRRLVGFLLVAVWPGALVILDEPTNDVDPLRRRLLWNQIRRLAEGGRAVLLVTHNVLEAERSVDRLAILHQGRILAQGTPGALRRKESGDSLRLDVTLEPGTSIPAVPAKAQLRGAAGRRISLHLPPSQVSRCLEWARQLVGMGVAEDFELGPITLEHTYFRLLEQSNEESAKP